MHLLERELQNTLTEQTIAEVYKGTSGPINIRRDTRSYFRASIRELFQGGIQVRATEAATMKCLNEVNDQPEKAPEVDGVRLKCG